LCLVQISKNKINKTNQNFLAKELRKCMLRVVKSAGFHLFEIDFHTTKSIFVGEPSRLRINVSKQFL